MPLGFVRPDAEDLFERLGEVGFLAFVHRGEQRGRRQFDSYRDHFAHAGDDRMRALFDAVLVDERRHEQYTGTLLREVAGGERAARRALRAAAAWEAWRSWRRAGRALAGVAYVAAMSVALRRARAAAAGAAAGAARAPPLAGHRRPRRGRRELTVAAVLGISAHYHDAAAALVVDGRIVAAMQEERFSRIKNDPSLPRRAARACLALGGLAAADLDAVVFYENPYAKLERVVVSLAREYPRSFRQFSPALGGQLGSKLWVLDQIADMLGVERRIVRFVEHHESHAACAFLCSPYADAAVLTVDGVGEAATTALWRGEGSSLRCLGAIDFPHSLGLLYAAFTAYLGFEVNEGEYKVMGLAAHGRPRFRDELARVLRLESDGSFDARSAVLRPRHRSGRGVLRRAGEAARSPPTSGAALRARRLRARRRRARSRVARSRVARSRVGRPRCADVAASLQLATEEALLGLARAARERTGASALCLAGGVALNALANARLAREAGFGRVFVPPAAGDAGGALGAALIGARDLGDPRPDALATAALGEPFDAGAAVDLARALGLTPLPVPDASEAAAARIAAGKVVALCRGRFECGPRALGQRSLLADATRAESRERLNRVIKQREPFRPFAPSVTAAAAPAFFAGAPNDMTPFMTTVCRTDPERAAALPAVVHVDGTARVQTVTALSAPELDPILTALGRETGVPVVLNTSLNGAGEPIVAGPVEALAFFLQHPVDALVIGDTLIERNVS